MNVEGRATIHCVVAARGLLENCSVDSEEPEDQGFGDAALRISMLFKMRPQVVDGQPVDGDEISIPINFRLPRWSGLDVRRLIGTDQAFTS